MATEAIDEALSRILRPGQTIVIGQALGTPMQLVAALPRHLDRLQGSRILLGWVLSDFPDLPGVAIDSFFPSGPFGSEAGLAQRNARYLRSTLHDLAKALASGSRPVDVAMAQATPPRDGAYSLGVTLDFVHPAAARARHVVLEINPNTPWTGPRSTIEAAEHVIAVAGDGPALSGGVLRAGQEALAANLLPWIPDGATLEFGIGQWFPPLVAQLAAARRNLRLHTGQIGQWVRQLIDADALNPDMPIIGTGAAGDAEFYRFLDRHPGIELWPATMTHDPEHLRRLPLFRAVNSVFEVDLLGQANSELAPNGALGGIAGLPDFARGACANPEGLSVVVLASTARGQSRIVPKVGIPVPSLASGEIDVIVTEQGSADLRGLSPADRAAAIIAIADETHRPALTEAAFAIL
ncbi:acetyl-CoA hydrolase/transferase C-terminal domain-containing protein [Flavisphingomonas formosensis]|uniref:acetyl-CoA hydrolase/transferase C-terminal domain-containing protein n=1 Tax=Flavisphingomonas formosensis TaxID=861534 RepID=UPI0012F96CDD|nr:acetyl-CoA hydrolase/transferase C-terminal domain-containing protein [Sphingomonas formosensis]